MKTYWLAPLAAAALALSGCGQNGAATTQAEAPQPQQATQDWYNQHQNHLPEGLRPEDRLSAEQEARLHEGAVLDRDLRERVRPTPPDLASRLPPPPTDHRYVVLGGHVGLIDNNFHVKAVIHLHDR